MPRGVFSLSPTKSSKTVSGIEGQHLGFANLLVETTTDTCFPLPLQAKTLLDFEKTYLMSNHTSEPN